MSETTATTADRDCALLVGEFEKVDSVLAAARSLSGQGFRKFDVHSPFPIHGIDRAMGVRPTVLPWLTLLGGIAGGILGWLLAWFTNAYDYPFLTSGKPDFSLPANIPVIFETTILFASFGTVVGMLFLNRLPRLHNPLFQASAFPRCTTDRFLVVVEATDPRFQAASVRSLLEEHGAASVEEVYAP